MIKKIALLLGTFFISIASFSTFVGLYAWNSNRKTAVIYLIISLAIVLCYAIFLFSLRKKFSSTFLILNVLLFIIVFVNGPQLQLYAFELKEQIKFPTKKIQRQLNQEVATAIENLKVLYRVDFEKSEEMTRQRRELVTVLMKNNRNEIQSTEINQLLNQSFSKDVFLSFYDYAASHIVSLYLTNYGEVTFCYPYSKCDELKINYE
ncbi:hypothetical protein [Paenibacillus antibioticophila]|uniref:hypothetical protein n=1 Tax=Paenibacillus antibioticophila TaxID=1274374 RepID=UPI0005C9BA19|nr:hypothetical protein [Paenibacillus antibioticophila]